MERALLEMQLHHEEKIEKKDPTDNPPKKIQRIGKKRPIKSDVYTVRDGIVYVNGKPLPPSTSGEKR